MQEPLLKTPLHGAHEAAGARMVPFAGYAMPVQYPDGVLKEHLWTREHAGLFDVSHMGPAWLTLSRPSGDPEADHAEIARRVEPLISGDISGLPRGQLRYTLLLNEAGGVIDDLMIGRPFDDAEQGRLYLVANAARKPVDFALFEAALGASGRVDRADAGALIALQGPEAAAVLSGVCPEPARLGFMRWTRAELLGARVVISRSGYTGEDGFEILASPGDASALWDALAGDARVRPIGLGARDSLRLEAGLPLYGHDLDETTSPIEAGLAFAVSRRRLKAGAMRGLERLRAELAGGLTRARIALVGRQGAPAREGAELARIGGDSVGLVTSGGYSPTLAKPVAIGFAPPDACRPGGEIEAIVRGRRLTNDVVALPFVPHRYVRLSEGKS